MDHVSHHSFVLSLYPTSRGFAFVFFEGPLSPFDWGVKEIRDRSKNAKTLASIQKIIALLHPDAIVIEDSSAKRGRRCSRIRKLYQAIIHLAATEEVELHQYSRAEIRQCFSTVGATRKYEIAQAIAREIPAFAHRMPRVRKIWMSEDPRMSLFDAAALGLTFFHSKAAHSGSP